SNQGPGACPPFHGILLGAPSAVLTPAREPQIFCRKLAPSPVAALDLSAYCETPVYNPDLCPNTNAAQAKLVYHLNKYYNEKCQARKVTIAKTTREVCKVVSDVLKEVEVQKPRFISSLNEEDNRYEGLEVISPMEFEVVLYLNQMGVFNFVDDGSLPGCAVLKLSDGWKRSMSLWVELITASGYLSARKIRSQTLVAQAVDKCSYRDVVKMVADTKEVKLRIRDRYVVKITPPSSVPASGPTVLSTSPYPTSPGRAPTGWPRSRQRASTCCPRSAIPWPASRAWQRVTPGCCSSPSPRTGCSWAAVGRNACPC
ncbi:unnamed protein product, partial [Staurois parvus]